jgi:hypothetical protein
MNEELARHQRRQENLQAMKSAPSIALGILTLVALVCATAFHDQPITNNNELFAYLRSFSSGAGG